MRPNYHFILLPKTDFGKVLFVAVVWNCLNFGVVSFVLMGVYFIEVIE